MGSGFGGAVSAYRLAEAGLSVCLIERGKPYPPGSFPRSPRRVRDNFWDPSEGLHGMFNLWSFRGLEALVSSGLGGGSLIYANVLIRKDERWFVKEDPRAGWYEHWPVTRADLEPHYDRAEKMLDAQRYPLEHPPYDATPKTVAVKEAAAKLGLEWQLPKLAVTFGNPGHMPVPGEPIVEARPNLHRRTRYTCRLCGECDLGCNYGSKNTLDYNYLTEAKRLGADVRTLCEVKSFEPIERRYAVDYVEHNGEEEGNRSDTGPLPRVRITCDRLVLSAGALGSPYLLLRNRSAFPRIGKALGTRFCGNGDLLTFVNDARTTTDGAKQQRVLDPGRGPVITCAVRVPDALDGGEGRGFYIEDAGYPEFANWMLETIDVPGAAKRAIRFGARRVWSRLTSDPRSDLSAEFRNLLLGDCDRSTTTLPLLGMGRDIPDGNMRLRDGYLEIDWTTKTSRDYFERVRDTMKDIAHAMEAELNDNPIWYLKRVITVHPLGGCPMGRNEREGVVDPYGRVFGYPGFFIADGSVMPGPVGANPSLTIAALADRSADRMVEPVTHQ
ncbi:MAG: GMC family oxidoreductase [Actinomycetota bacterium]|nr:GMC family oxidoreductase [Actinomycetota bacterium]